MIATQTQTPLMARVQTPINQVVIPNSATLTKVQLDPSDSIIGRSVYTVINSSYETQVEVVEPKNMSVQTTYAAKQPSVENTWDIFPPRIRNIFHSAGYNPNDNSVRYVPPEQPPVAARTMEEPELIRENDPSVLADMQLVYNNGYPELGRNPVMAPKSILEEDMGRLLLTGSRAPNIKIFPMPRFINDVVQGGVSGTDRIKANDEISEQLNRDYISSKYGQ